MRFIMWLCCMLLGIALFAPWGAVFLCSMIWCQYKGYDVHEHEDWMFPWYPIERLDEMFR